MLINSQKDLVYDVGLHHGDDTAYYLQKGFRVIAIEANPVLARKCEERFSDAVDARRLTILNVGVGATAGKFEFWVHTAHDEWSSFYRNPNWKDAECHAIEVDCIPFSDVIREFGVPLYLKVDIEGADGLVIRSLSNEARPTYVSFEGSDDAFLNIAHLRALGYEAFKIVDQTVHNEPNIALAWNNEKAWRRNRDRLVKLKWEVTRKLRLDQSRAGQLWRAGRAQLNKDEGEHRRAGWTFPTGSSGPFGEESPGPWRTAEEVLYDWLHRSFRHADRGTLRPEPWYDFHARLGPISDD